MKSSHYVLNLKRLIRDLGDHFDALMVDEYTAPCPGCGEQLSQETDWCEVCKVPVIWEGSRVWKDLYGPPKDVARMIRVNQVLTGEEVSRWTAIAKKSGKKGRALTAYTFNLLEKKAREKREAEASAEDLASPSEILL
jgi:hypothetical protein